MEFEIVQSKKKSDLDEEVVIERDGYKKKVEIQGNLRMESETEDSSIRVPIKRFKGVKKGEDEIRAVFELNGKKMNGKEVKELNFNFKNQREFRAFLESLQRFR